MLCLRWVVVRIQIQLTDRQARRLRAEAGAHGVSSVELVRRYVDKGLSDDTADRAALYDRAVRFAGRFVDRRGAADVSARHDRYLDEAFD